MIRRDQYGRDIRKVIESHISFDLLQTLYDDYMENNGEHGTMSESPEQYIKRVASTYGLSIKQNEFKPKQGIRQPSQEQLDRHNEWVRENQKKAAQSLGKKLKTEISKFSKKRQKIETSYKKELASKADQTHGRICCQGCGTFQGYIDPSHLIPRDVRIDLIDDPENVHWHCRQRCHALCESGDYSALNDGKEIIEYIKRVAPDYLLEKLKGKAA